MGRSEHGGSSGDQQEAWNSSADEPCAALVDLDVDSVTNKSNKWKKVEKNDGQ